MSNNNGGLFSINTNSLFGNKSTNLFNNNNNNNNQSSNIFGTFGNNNPQGQGLFGNNTNNQNAGLFGNNTNTQQTSIFGNNNPGNSLFNNNPSNNQTGLFGNNNNNNNLLNQNQQIPNTTFYTTVKPVIALNQNNDIKNIQLCKLPREFQEAVITLKTNLKSQEIKLDELQRYSQRLIDLIDQNNKAVGKLSEFNNFLNQKLNNYSDIVKQIKENYIFISESFEEEQNTIRLMEQDLGFKIEIPSKFLLSYSKNLQEKTEIFKKRLKDIITLIKVYYAQSNNDFNYDSDIIESTIAEFIKIVRSLLETNATQEKMINELFQIILRFVANMGENPEIFRNNVIQHSLELNQGV